MIIDELKTMIDDSGLVADYKQTNFFNESKHPNKTVAYRINGGAGTDQYIRNPDVDFTFYGSATDSANDIGLAADNLFSYFLDNYRSSCIIGISALSEVNGVYYTDTERPFYTFSIRLKTAR